MRWPRAPLLISGGSGERALSIWLAAAAAGAQCTDLSLRTMNFGPGSAWRRRRRRQRQRLSWEEMTNARNWRSNGRRPAGANVHFVQALERQRASERAADGPPACQVSRAELAGQRRFVGAHPVAPAHHYAARGNRRPRERPTPID